MTSRVAVLCVAPRSEYKSIAEADCFDKARDVRTFEGGAPVVAHPPCRAWSIRCAHQAKPEAGEKELGPLCVEWLKKCGGVLEHPAHSRLFEACGLPMPGEKKSGLWTVAVSQAWWGTPTEKRTWLCFAHVDPRAVHFPLILRAEENDARRWQLLSRVQRSATPRPLADWLLTCARLCSR